MLFLRTQDRSRLLWMQTARLEHLLSPIYIHRFGRLRETREIRFRWAPEQGSRLRDCRQQGLCLEERRLLISSGDKEARREWVKINNITHNIKCSTGVSSRATNPSSARLLSAWSILKSRTHLSHVKEFKIVCFFVPLIHIGIRTRSWTLSIRALESCLVAKHA